MSALSNKVIKARLISRNLVVSPILNKEQIGESSIDLRMGTIALVSRAGAQSHVDPCSYRDDHNKSESHDRVQEKKQKHERYDIPFKESYLLHPGSLALVPTLEWVSLPYDLQGLVTARSSWAREGLNIATATLINPGYRGIITLELANFGEIPIKLFPGLRLAQIAFYDLLIESEQNKNDNMVKTSEGQFNMSFEPTAGNIVGDDWPFVPELDKN
jgi:dCTP deaminase